VGTYDYLNVIGGLNILGTEPSGAGFTTELNTFLGVSQTALDTNSATQSVEGPALKQIISLAASDKVGFKSQFLSADLRSAMLLSQATACDKAC
jgi:hypothetical protein